ncbi:MAG: hypothetical protein QW500_00055 [Candidatus Micrarchaeia archaeon]
MSVNINLLKNRKDNTIRNNEPKRSFIKAFGKAAACATLIVGISLSTPSYAGEASSKGLNNLLPPKATITTDEAVNYVKNEVKGLSIEELDELIKKYFSDTKNCEKVKCSDIEKLEYLTKKLLILHKEKMETDKELEAARKEKEAARKEKEAARKEKEAARKEKEAARKKEEEADKELEAARKEEKEACDGMKKALDMMMEDCKKGSKQDCDDYKESKPIYEKECADFLSKR